MLDRTKQLSDQITPSTSPTSTTSHLLSAADIRHIDNRHLTIAKYLPLTTFKNTATLQQALDNILCEINMQQHLGSAPHLRKTAINCMLVSLAKNIAMTTADLNIDYASKLDLIDTALIHRIFKPRSLITRCMHILQNYSHRIKSSLFKSKNRYQDKHLTDSQVILVDARSNIQTSRNNIILC